VNWNDADTIALGHLNQNIYKQAISCSGYRCISLAAVFFDKFEPVSSVTNMSCQHLATFLRKFCIIVSRDVSGVNESSHNGKPLESIDFIAYCSIVEDLFAIVEMQVIVGGRVAINKKCDWWWSHAAEEDLKAIFKTNEIGGR
jgi:hypothetical protein